LRKLNHKFLEREYSQYLKAEKEREICADSNDI